mgnify:FL=1|tara:strand:- start:404 stop:544 length:141 start_codon:yes stop_codon:yes gene_type:complete
MKKIAGKLKLIYLLSESLDLRNDKHDQAQFKELYKAALIAYIKDYY